MNMKRINYKSDFDFILHLYSCLVDSDGKEVEGSRKELEWPDYDWTARLYTSVRSNAYIASCIGGVATNCYNDNGKIHVVVDGHHIGPGQLRVEFTAELSREIYPDGAQRKVFAQLLDIELVTGHGDCPSAAEAELLLPFIKGDKGDKLTYADLTEADKADLIAPIKKEVDKKADRTELSGVLSRDPEEELAAAEPDFLTLMLRKNEQVLTEAERRQVLENLGRPDIEWLITYFNYMANRYVAGYGGYNEATGYFELGTVKDLTVQDVLRIILSPQGISGCSITDSEAEGRMAYSEVRALFPIKLSAGAFGQSNFSRRYFGCKELEEVVFLRDYGSFVNNSFYRAFYDCLKLRVLKFGYTSVATCTFGEAFENCHALEDFTPPYFWASMKLYDSPKLSVESLERIIARATPPKGDTKGITITLHADAFARLSDELMAAAAEKNITLTTP